MGKSKNNLNSLVLKPAEIVETDTLVLIKKRGRWTMACKVYKNLSGRELLKKLEQIRVSL